MLNVCYVIFGKTERSVTVDGASDFVDIYPLFFEEQSMTTMKKAILVTSFGTSYADTRALTIEACENDIARTFPDYEIRRSFTSHMIIRRLKERDGMTVPTPEEALAALTEEGVKEVIVQPLHIIPGEEFHEKIVKKIIPFTKLFDRLLLGRPLLYFEKDYLRTVEGIKGQLPVLKDGEAVVLMGHGTGHPANACYSCLQSFLDDAELPVFLANVEGYPELDVVIPRLQKRNIRKITLMPFMLVAGDHARNDMAGDADDSWISVLRDKGFEVHVYMHGLGENPRFREMYTQRVGEAINGVHSCL